MNQQQTINTQVEEEEKFDACNIILSCIKKLILIFTLTSVNRISSDANDQELEQKQDEALIEQQLYQLKQILDGIQNDISLSKLNTVTSDTTLPQYVQQLITQAMSKKTVSFDEMQSIVASIQCLANSRECSLQKNVDPQSSPSIQANGLELSGYQFTDL